MTIKKSVFAAILALVLVLGLAAGAGAANLQQKVTATVDAGIAIKYEGEVVTPKDATGNRIYPLTYNGYTYLPLRAVGNLMGLDVGWDQPTRTVLLGKASDGVDLIETYKFYDRNSSDQYQVQNSEKQEQEISGITCSHWLRLHNGWAGDKGDQAHLSFNVQGNHDTLTFRYYANQDIILRVLGDNDYVLFETTISGGKVAQTTTVPLLKTSQITFQTEKLADGGDTIDTYIFDTVLK